MQYAWYHTTFDALGMSLLFLNTGFQYEAAPTELRENNLQTFGTYLSYKKSGITADLGLYGQTGKTRMATDNATVRAFYAGLTLNYALTSKVSIGAGYEYLSGTGQDNTDAKNKSFNPIFGTNHGFNGFMDYFYVGNYKNTVGLQDVFLKLGYSQDKWQFNMMPHLFMTAATVLDPQQTTEKMDSYLGTEIDITAAYALQKDITITGGYSQMFGSGTLEVLKSGNKGLDNNWAWLMIKINPRIFTTAK